MIGILKNKKIIFQKACFEVNIVAH